LAEIACTIETFAASDGYALRYRRYPAEGAMRGRIVYIHGIQSHGGWYGYSCSELAKAGFEVLFLDRRGSGLNEQDRGDAPSFRRLLDDLAEFLRTLPRGNPLFLLAVSWGGKLAAALQRRHPGLADGLVLACPGFFPQVKPPLLQRIRIFLSRFVKPRRRFPIPLSDPELFTATPHWLQFLRDDPLALHDATSRFLLESARLDVYLRMVPRHIHIPVLLLLAQKDRIVANKPTRQYAERFATADLEVIEVAGAHHTLEFEPEPELFLANVKRWLDEKCRQHGPDPGQRK